MDSGAPHPTLAALIARNDFASIASHCEAVQLQRKATSLELSSVDAAAIAVGEAIWKREIESFYKAIRGFSWDSSMQPLAVALEHATRERAFALFARAYSCVHIRTIAHRLGVPENVARAECVSRGWIPDDGGSGPFLRPPPVSSIDALPSEDPARKVAALAEQLVRMQTTA